MIFASIDPGKHVTALAVWNDARLVGAFVGPAPEAIHFAQAERATEFAIVEVPVVYPRSMSKGDPNDLIAVTFAAGYVSCAFAHFEKVAPGAWAGDVPKAVRHRRIRIDHPEIAAFLDASLFPKEIAHNAWDAVGIGLWFLRTQHKIARR